MENFWQPIVDWIWQVGPRILWALVTFVVGWYLSKLVVKLLKRAMERGRAEKGAVTFISSVVNILLKLLAAITAAAQLGMDVTSIIAAVGTMGVAVGLAIKDSMSNVASGVQILFTHPFRQGITWSPRGWRAPWSASRLCIPPCGPLTTRRSSSPTRS